MSKLSLEQLPNDGGYHIKQLVNEANERLDQIGRRGKRAKIVAKKTSLSLQFSFNDGNGNPQKNVGLNGIFLNTEGVEEAEGIARIVTKWLVEGKFDWSKFHDLIGKDTSGKTPVLTCREMVREYKQYYLKQKKGNKSPEASWYNHCRFIEIILDNQDKSLSISLINQIIDLSENNSQTRKFLLNGLAGFLKYFGNSDYKDIIKNCKANNKIKRKDRNVPDDKRIIEVYETGFLPDTRCSKGKIQTYPKWQFLYGLLATYGLRIHEAWNIANWDKPVTLKNGDWVEVDINEDESYSIQHDGGELIIPAILDPQNKDHILCIKHDTKTGYRMAMPVSPEGHNWIEEFNLLQPLNLPDIKNPMRRIGTVKGSFYCTNTTGTWFRRKRYGFTAHDLRHACNHRGHLLGCNPKALADSFGHSMQMNANSYLRHMSNKVKLQGIKEAISKDKERRTELDIIRDENKAIKSKLQAAENEIELLRTKLKMYEAVKESRGQK